MRDIGNRQRPNKIQALIGILLSLPVLLWAAWRISQGTLKPVVFLIAGFALLVVLLRRDYKRTILIAAFGSLVLGWRGFEISPGFRVFPAEFFVWLGILHLLASSFGGAGSKEGAMPLAAIYFALISLMGLAVASINSNSLTWAIGEAKAFIIFFPILILLRSWVSSVDDVRSYTSVLVVSGTIIAALGLVERFFPSVSNVLPEYFTHPISVRENFRGGGEIVLSGFSSWGGPIVAVVLVPLVGLCTALHKQAAGARMWFWIVSEVVLVAGIVVSGYRSSWLGLIALFCVLFLVYRTSFTIYVIAAATIVYLLPPEYFARFNSIALLSRSGDSSILRRADALDKGLERIWDNPLLGMGWGAPTIFNDWLYIAVALGIPSLLLFALWYAGLLARLWRRIRWTDFRGQLMNRHLTVGFFAGLLSYAICMVSGAMSQVPPLMTCFWLIFCLGYRLTELETASTETALLTRGHSSFGRPSAS